MATTPINTTTTTPTTTTSTSSLSLIQQMQQAQRAADTQLAMLSYNVFPGADGKNVNLNLTIGASAANDARAPFESQLRALLDRSPPLSPAEINAEGTKIINAFRNSVMPAPKTPTTTTTTTTGLTPEERAAALQRSRALDPLVAQLNYNVFPGADGKTVNIGRTKTPAEIAAIRTPFADKMKALLTQTPPLTPAQITTEGNKLIAAFRAAVTGAGPVAGATGAGDDAARQAAVTQALADLGVNTFKNFDDADLDLTKVFQQSEIDSTRAPYADKIRALLTKSPQLSADQIKTEAAKIVKEFRDEMSFKQGLIDILMRNAFMFFMRQSAHIQSVLRGGY